MGSTTSLYWQLDNGCIDQIGNQLQRKLANSDYYALRRIQCHVGDGRLMLRGRVPTYLLGQVKQTVQEVIGDCS